MSIVSDTAFNARNASSLAGLNYTKGHDHKTSIAAALDAATTKTAKAKLTRALAAAESALVVLGRAMEVADAAANDACNEERIQTEAAAVAKAESDARSKVAIAQVEARLAPASAATPIPVATTFVALEAFEQKIRDLGVVAGSALAGLTSFYLHCGQGVVDGIIGAGAAKNMYAIYAKAAKSTAGGDSLKTQESKLAPIMALCGAHGGEGLDLLNRTIKVRDRIEKNGLKVRGGHSEVISYIAVQMMNDKEGPARAAVFSDDELIPLVKKPVPAAKSELELLTDILASAGSLYKRFPSTQVQDAIVELTERLEAAKTEAAQLEAAAAIKAA